MIVHLVAQTKLLGFLDPGRTSLYSKIMASKIMFLFALVCMAAVLVEVAAEVEPTYRWVEVSAGVGLCVGGMVLMVGIAFATYEFNCRNYFTGKAGEYCRLDQEVAEGNLTKL